MTIFTQAEAEYIYASSRPGFWGWPPTPEPLLRKISRHIPYRRGGSCVPNTYNRQLERNINHPPTPLPSERPRRLSGPFPSTSPLLRRKGQTMKTQFKSLLFTKLPLELRRQIYELALGDGPPIHIVRWSTHRFSHYRCSFSQLGRACLRNVCLSDWPENKDSRKWVGNNLSSLLCTCRAM